MKISLATHVRSKCAATCPSYGPSSLFSRSQHGTIAFFVEKLLFQLSVPALIRNENNSFREQMGTLAFLSVLPHTRTLAFAWNRTPSRCRSAVDVISCLRRETISRSFSSATHERMDLRFQQNRASPRIKFNKSVKLHAIRDEIAALPQNGSFCFLGSVRSITTQSVFTII